MAKRQLAIIRSTDAGHAPAPSRPDRIVISLSSGRELQVERSSAGEQIVVTQGAQEVVHIDIDAHGVRIRAARARLELEATEDLELSGRRVAIRATEHLVMSSGGDADVAIDGSRTTLIGGDERLDASAIELQARREHVDVRANGAIRIDGEHIALNGDPCPSRFGWSREHRSVDGQEADDEAADQAGGR